MMRKKIKGQQPVILFLTALLVSISFFISLKFLSNFLEESLFYIFAHENIQNFSSAQLKFHNLIKERREQKNQEMLRELQNKGISAESVLILKIRPDKSKKIIVKKNIHHARPIASLTKLITALTVFEHYDLNREVVISKEAVRQERDAGSLRVGEKIRVKDLLFPLLIESSNDAGYALAEVVGLKKFAQLMNEEARKIGLQRSHFSNPIGEDDNGNYSTAYDLALLADYILNNYPEIFTISKIREKPLLVPCQDNPKELCYHHYMTNTNVLLWEMPDVVGSKTGWSPEAKECLLLVVKKEEDIFINIILGSDDRFGDMKKLLYYFDK